MFVYLAEEDQEEEGQEEEEKADHFVEFQDRLQLDRRCLPANHNESRKHLTKLLLGFRVSSGSHILISFGVGVINLFTIIYVFLYLFTTFRFYYVVTWNYTCWLLVRVV